MKQLAWDVYLNNKIIDTVWFDEDMTEDQVEDALINHDNYDPAIVVHCPASQPTI